MRDDLREADVVIPSLDAATPLVFDHVNRPHPLLNLEEILWGLAQFRKELRNQIWLEVLLCRGVNDDRGEVERIKEAVDRIEPDRRQLNTCVGAPPAKEYAFPLTMDQLLEIADRLGRGTEIISECSSFSGRSLRSEHRCGDHGTEFHKGDPARRMISLKPWAHPGAVKKRLASLEKRGAIHFCVYQHACYYEHKRHNRSEGVVSR